MICVYRYIDIKDGIIKYVGIVVKQPLRARLVQHRTLDDWATASEYKIQYFEVETQSDAEVWEAHLISEYKTYNYYNIKKSSWGLCSYLNSQVITWKDFDFTVRPKVKKRIPTINNIVKGGFGEQRLSKVINQKIFYLQSQNVDIVGEDIYITKDDKPIYEKEVFIEYLPNEVYAGIVGTGYKYNENRRRDGERIKRSAINSLLISSVLYDFLFDNNLLEKLDNFKYSLYTCEIKHNNPISRGHIFGWFDEDGLQDGKNAICKLENLLDEVFFYHYFGNQVRYANALRNIPLLKVNDVSFNLSDDDARKILKESDTIDVLYGLSSETNDLYFIELDEYGCAKRYKFTYRVHENHIYTSQEKRITASEVVRDNVLFSKEYVFLQLIEKLESFKTKSEKPLDQTPTL